MTLESFQRMSRSHRIGQANPVVQIIQPNSASVLAALNKKKIMGTRARIGILNSDGSVRSIYVGSDGYLSWTGTRLLKYFNTPGKVRKLISLGALRILGNEIGEKHDAVKHHDEHPTWCMFYERDQGEKGMGATTHPTLGAIFTEEYHYLFKDGQWWLVTMHGPLPIFTDLRLAVATDRITS